MDIRKLKINKESNKITILALSWRDIESPDKGGAEVQTHAMLTSLPRDKYQIIHISPLYAGMQEYSEIDGISYYRDGTIYSVIWYAFVFYQHNHKRIDVVIDQCNTHRFFTPLYVSAKKRILYIHQMTREIWRISMRYPLCIVGEKLEDFITKIYRKGNTITVSESTKKNLTDLGFDKDKILIIPQMLKQKPVPYNEIPNKYETPTFVYVGRYSPYKGIDVAVEALGLLKKEYTNCKLHILGGYSSDYVETYLRPICEKYSIVIGQSLDCDVCCDGFVSEEDKLSILGKSHALLFPSIREGWGIPISEAAYVGTPSIVFDSDGLRDAVDYGRAGYLTEENTANCLAKNMKDVIENTENYERIRRNAYEFTREYLGKNYVRVLDEFLRSYVE